ncbi:hypothetical protein PYCC9005_003708 [Savitreella phatthalungensis]
MSSAIKLDLDRGDGIAICTLDDGKVNIMTEELWVGLSTALKTAEAARPRIRAIVFRSGLKKPVFTAGNDITRLYAPNTNVDAYTVFWRAQNVFLAALAGSPLVSAAVLKGATPAGGCALSLCCDFRFASKDTTMGLNEARIGISVPGMWQIQMAHVLGSAHVAERLCSLGNFVDAAQASPASRNHHAASLGIFSISPKDSASEVGKAAAQASAGVAVSPQATTTESVVYGGLGLVDGVYNDSAAAEAACLATLREILKLVPDAGRILAKNQARGEHVARWGDVARIDAEAKDKWPFLASEPVVKVLGATLARLQGGSKRKAPSSPKM